MNYETIKLLYDLYYLHIKNTHGSIDSNKCFILTRELVMLVYLIISKYNLRINSTPRSNMIINIMFPNDASPITSVLWILSQRENLFCFWKPVLSSDNGSAKQTQCQSLTAWHFRFFTVDSALKLATENLITFQPWKHAKGPILLCLPTRTHVATERRWRNHHFTC